MKGKEGKDREREKERERESESSGRRKQWSLIEERLIKVFKGKSKPIHLCVDGQLSNQL